VFSYTAYFAGFQPAGRQGLSLWRKLGLGALCTFHRAADLEHFGRVIRQVGKKPALLRTLSIVSSPVRFDTAPLCPDRSNP